MPGEHQQPCCDEVLASPTFASEPATGDDPGTLGADIVTPLSHLGEVINQRLELGPFRSQQGFDVELGGQDLVFGGRAPSLSAYRPRKSEPSARVFYRQANSEERNEVTHDRRH